jgi:hypothetical protein
MSTYLQATYGPLHQSFVVNERYVDLLGGEDGWVAIEVGINGYGNNELGRGNSMEEALIAAEMALSC